ncbi:hypothetical protein [Caudoviricetes sp.]|nr:hypothetical protein [Caudoviricetes sp.]UOF82777.1 hypothetical protein [Caudoviricetes sp.]
MDQQKRVFVVTTNTKVDLEPARKKGSVIVLFDRSAGVDLGSPFDPEKICKSIRKRLSDLKYDPSKDLVAIYGSFVYMTCLAGVLATDHGQIKVLIFNAADSSYVERELDFRGLR